MERSHKAKKTEAFHQTDLEKHCCKTFHQIYRKNLGRSFLRAIHKGCPHIRGEGGQAKVGKCKQGDGVG